MRKISLIRLAGGLLALSAWSFVMLWAAARSPAALTVALGALYALPQLSFWEWVIHGTLYHKPLPGGARIREIHMAHHWGIFPPDRYVHDGRYAFMRIRGPLKPYEMSDNLLDSVITSGGQMLFHFVAGLPLIVAPAWFLSPDRVFFGAVLGTHVVVSFLFAYVHGCIHTPRDRLVERTRWFRFLDRHHYVHHIDNTVNVNFLLPLSDWMFGTLRLLSELTPAERDRFPSFDEAKGALHRPPPGSPEPVGSAGLAAEPGAR